jgi:acetyl-CoA synthase
LKDKINERAKEEGIENFADMIADETVGTTQEEILPWLKEKGHPALSKDPIM